MPVSVTDLFALGVGLDLAGAYLLGRGLLADDMQLMRASMDIPGQQVDDAVGRARDRIDARIGLRSLVGGFAVQALAYTLTLSGLGTAESGIAHALVGAGAAVLGAGGVLLLWAKTRTGRCGAQCWSHPKSRATGCAKSMPPAWPDHAARHGGRLPGG